MPYVAPLPPKARDLRPVRASSVVRAVSALLSADDDLASYLGAGDAALGRSRLHTTALPLHDSAGVEANAAPLWVLVKQRQRLDGAAQPSGVAGQRPIRIHVLVSADPSASTDMISVVGQVHDRIYDILQDETVTGDGFALVDPIDCVDEADEPMLDPRRGGDGRVYSSAVYRAIAEPSAPAY